MLDELARRVGRLRGYAGWHWAQTQARWRAAMRLVLRVGLAWVAATLVIAAIRLWNQR